MTLVDLTSRSRFRISQDLGSQAEGCRLDARGIAEIGPLLERTLNQDVELIVLNRFGKAEAEGGGLRSAFVRAMEAGIPTADGGAGRLISRHGRSSTADLRSISRRI